MVIKVQNPGAQPTVATTQQIVQLQTDLSINPAAIDSTAAQTLINANSSLGALALPVQSLVDVASVNNRARANHTGFDPAQNVNVTLPNGTIQTLQAYITALEIRLTTLGSTAPVNTVQPTAPTGTLTVGSTLTAVTGTWTGASTYNYVWYRVNTTTGVTTATGGTNATYVLQSVDAGFKMAVSVAGVSSTGFPATPLLSAFTSAVGVTLPTNSVVPAVTPSGTQSVGTLLTSTTGTWSNASGAIYTYQWTLAGVAISGATANTYTPITGQEGKAINCAVLATTTQGAASSSAVSNTITIAGTASLTFTSAPAFPSTVTSGTAATIIDATFTTTGGFSSPVLVSSNVYINTSSLPYVTITADPSVYTPFDDSYMTTKTQTTNPPGLTTLVGQGVTCNQIWSYNNSNYVSTLSTSKTVQAVSATLTASTQTTGISWPQNTAITSIQPVTATGGTTPYSYAITSGTTALPTGLTINPATGFISGTPTTVVTNVSYSITVTDAASTPATSTSTFTASVTNASSLTPLVYISAGNTFSSTPGYVQLLGGQQNLSTISDTSGISGSGNITTAPSGVSQTLRFGKITDPLDSSKKCYYMAAKSSDPVTFNHSGRVEIGLGEAGTNGAFAKSGTTYWLATELYLPAVRFGGGSGTLVQIHNSNPNSVSTGPLELGFIAAGEVFPNLAISLQRIQQPTVPGSFTTTYPFASDNQGFPGNVNTDFITQTWPAFAPGVTAAQWPRDMWTTLLIKYRGDPTGTTGIFQAWLICNGTTTQILNETNIRIGTNDGSLGPVDYGKTGLDDSSTGGGTNGEWELRRKFAMYQDSGQTFSQIYSDFSSRT